VFMLRAEPEDTNAAGRPTTVSYSNTATVEPVLRLLPVTLQCTNPHNTPGSGLKAVAARYRPTLRPLYTRHCLPGTRGPHFETNHTCPPKASTSRGTTSNIPSYGGVRSASSRVPPINDESVGVRLSKLLSLILRHSPEKFGVVLDPEGYAGLQDVLRAVRTAMPDASENDLVSVVAGVEPEKRRFTISDGEIRANYGHSLETRIEHAVGIPPDSLWHGTSDRAIAGIAEHGLLPMKRQYVHLTTDVGIATRVGARYGTPRVLRVDAARAHSAGVVFYTANDTFWLAERVPPEYVDLQGTARSG
jgi:putative RNA 2'-phosphotransferase